MQHGHAVVLEAWPYNDPAAQGAPKGLNNCKSNRVSHMRTNPMFSKALFCHKIIYIYTHVYIFKYVCTSLHIIHIICAIQVALISAVPCHYSPINLQAAPCKALPSPGTAANTSDGKAPSSILLLLATERKMSLDHHFSAAAGF